MLEENQGQFWNLHQFEIPIKVIEIYFQILVKNSFYLRSNIKKKCIFRNNYSTLRKSSIIEKITQKLRKIVCSKFDTDTKSTLHVLF